MAGNSFGKIFRITNWGESHGEEIGVVIDGCPSQISLTSADIQKALDKRKPGQSHLTTQRCEEDRVEIQSGVYLGKTTGTPISLVIKNMDARSKDYTKMNEGFRPSHADFTYQEKYKIRDPYGGGRSSARLTAGNVASGAVAKKVLLHAHPKLEIIAYVKWVKDICAQVNPETVTQKQVDANALRCPDEKAANQMIKLIEKTMKDGDSLGGIVECVVRNVPVGLGEPLFDKMEADLAKAMLAINATKGFEIGSGFSGTTMYGSQHNDGFLKKGGRIVTATNHSGGVQGGITNGMPLVFRVAFKPTSTIHKPQKTVDKKGKSMILLGEGRHDPCVLPRAVPIVEAMTALVLCDHYLRYKAYW